MISKASDSKQSDHPSELPCWKRWLLVLGCLALVATAVNWLLPIPDVNDFRGFGEICLLMERRGLLYCINEGWGFANPLLNYLLTKLTGDLLVSQRALGLLGAVGCLIFADRAMWRLFAVSRPVRTAFLLAMICTPWMVGSWVNVALDIIPISLTLAAVSMLGARRLSSYFIAGLVASTASWFRFHFAGYAVVFIALVAVHSWGRRPVAKAAITSFGVAVGFAVPVLLTELAFGVPSVTNQKLIVALLMDSFSWSVQFQSTLNAMPFSTILSNIHWTKVIVWRFYQLTEWLPFVLLIALCIIHLAGLIRQRTPLLGRRRFLKHLCQSAISLRNEPTVLVMLFIITAISPFLLLRELTLRLESALFLVAFPWLAGVYSLQRQRLGGGLVLAIILIALAGTPTLLYGYLSMHRSFEQMDREVRAVIPASVAMNTPEKLVDGITDFPNRHHRYWLWNPVVMGGWPARWKPLGKEFGVIDLASPPTNAVISEIKYLLLATKPQLVFERYDERWLKLGRRCGDFKNVVVLELAEH